MSANYNFKKWRLGLFLSIAKSLAVAGSTALAGGDWKVFMAAFCTALVATVESYLKQHPIEDISETDFTKK